MGSNQTFAGRVATGLFSLATAVTMALSYAPESGAACTQVCADGTSNTFFGVSAGVAATGTINTGFGVGALSAALTGQSNTAIGDDALASDTSGGNNTAAGTFALIFNSTGNDNTATGSGALFENDGGNENTADGGSALGNNVSGSDNTATGFQSLLINTTGSNNTADGAFALARNTGANNTAVGEGALQNNVSGGSDTAVGRGALKQNTTGRQNVGIGLHALSSNTIGHNNIGIGVNAGDNLTTGSNNIEIGSEGTVSDSKTIRIGGAQTATYIAGISGAGVTGADVVINASGRLGVVASSARYKHDIRDMGTTSADLMKLHPVTFEYKDDDQATRQYGLLAEEVERVYPELVTYGRDGRVETVRYSMLTSMLLNEVQRAERERLRQGDSITRLSRELAEARLTARDQARRLAALERAVAARDARRTLPSSAP